MSNPGPCALHTVRPKKLKHWSLEYRKVYCKGYAQRTLRKPELTVLFREEFFVWLVLAAACSFQDLSSSQGWKPGHSSESAES